MANTIDQAFDLYNKLTEATSHEEILDELINVIPADRLYEYLQDVATNFDIEIDDDDPYSDCNIGA